MTFVPARMIPNPIPPEPPAPPAGPRRPFVPARMYPDPIPSSPQTRPFVPARMIPDPHVIAPPVAGDGRVQRLADFTAFLDRLLDEADD